MEPWAPPGSTNSYCSYYCCMLLFSSWGGGLGLFFYLILRIFSSSVSSLLGLDELPLVKAFAACNGNRLPPIAKLLYMFAKAPWEFLTMGPADTCVLGC
jgi:hypothetical protein